MTKLHPACRDNFVVFAFHRTIVTLFLPYLAAFRNNFHPGNRASPVVSVYMKNFHPGKRDLASFKRDLANRASPLVPYKRTVTVIRKTVARRDLAYRAVSPSGPARLPYKQPLIIHFLGNWQILLANIFGDQIHIHISIHIKSRKIYFPDGHHKTKQFEFIFLGQVQEVI